MLGNPSSEADGGDGDPDASSHWHSLSPQAVRIWRIRATAIAGMWLAAVWTAALLTRVGTRPAPLGMDIPFLATVASALVVVGWAAVFLVAPRRYRRWRWAVHDQRLIVENGWWRKRRRQAPTVDIHTVSERVGPILRASNACSVDLHASGPIGSVTLPIIDRDAMGVLRRQLGFDE